MAFPTGWGRKCALVIQASKVDSNQVDYPNLLTEDTLPSEMFDADGNYPALNGGGDIRFSSDADGSTRLACEVVTFTIDNDPANGVAEIWVKVPSVSSSANTTIYVWYNKTGESQPIPSDVYGSENVWDSNFKMVQHMEDATTSTITDSTSNSNDGTKLAANEPIEATGQIGKGQNFDGVDDVITLNTENEFTSTSKISIFAWINPDVVSLYRTIVAKRNGAVCTFQFRIGLNSGDKRVAWAWTDGGNWQSYYTNAPTISASVLSRIGVTFDWASPDNVNIWINETKYVVSRNDGVGTSPDDANVPITFGRRYDDAMEFDGIEDEISISDIIRSDDWSKAEYNNQYDPSTFVIEGTPESGAGQSASLSDTFSLSEIFTPLANYKANLSDSLNMSESQQAIGQYKRILSDSLNFSESISPIGHFLRALSDDLSMTDVLSVLAKLKASTSDTLTLTDSITVTASYKGALSDTITLTDNFSALLKALASLSDILSLTDSITYPLGQSASLSDTLSLTDSASAKASLLAAISDVFTLSDTTSAFAKLKAVLSDTFNLSDEIITKLTGNLVDTLILTDSATGIGHFLTTLADTITLTDSASGVVHFKVSLSDTLNFSEQISALAKYAATIIDTLHFTDEISGVSISITGELTITFSSSKPTMVFLSSKPTITLS